MNPASGPESAPESAPVPSFAQSQTGKTAEELGYGKPADPGKRRRGRLIALIAALTAVALIIGSFVAVSASGILITLFGSPFEQIAAAAKKTAGAGGFHLSGATKQKLTVNDKVEADITQNITGDLLMNLKKRQIGYYFECEPEFRVAMRDGIVLAGINAPAVNDNGQYFVDASGALIRRFTGEREDVSEELDDFFFNYNHRKKKPLLERNKGFVFADVEADIKELFDTEIHLSDYLVEDAFNRMLETCRHDFNDEEWLKDYLGYSKSEADDVTYMSFAPDLIKLFKYVKEQLAPCLVSEYRTPFEESLDSVIDALKKMNGSMSLTFRFGICRGYLTEFTLTADTDQTYVQYYPYSNAKQSVHRVEHAEISIILSDFGKARPDDAAIDRLDADVQKYLEQTADVKGSKKKA